MFAVIATLTAQPGTADRMAAALAEAAPHCRSDAEPGCLYYQPTRTVDDDHVFKVFEVYESAEAFAAHRDTPHFQPLKALFGEILAAPPQVDRLETFG